MPRFLFYAPSVKAATGGVSVIVEWVHLLRSAGIEAELVTDTRDYVYSFSDIPVRAIYSDEVRRARVGQRPIWRELHRVKQRLPYKRQLTDLKLRPNDVVLIPEYAAGWLPSAFPEQRHILLVQAYVWFCDRMLRSTWDVERFATAIATSDLCAEVATMAGVPAVHQVPLAVDVERFQPLVKKDLIAYMPRKRGGEADFVVSALTTRGRVADYRFVPIDGVPPPEVARILGEARLFLSLSEREGFGLPPAEAMA